MQLLAERDARLLNASVEIAKLRAQFAALRRQHYGRSSERLDAEIAQLELRLEDLEETEAEHQAAAQRPCPTRQGLSGNAARPPAAHCRTICRARPCCMSPRCLHLAARPARLARLGEDVTEVLEKIPARLKVIRHVRPRYACRVCEAVFQAPAPDLPIERGRPGPGLIAHVAVAKYCDGLPLFRQSVILAREGVEIDRVTLADWIGRAAWWLAPLARLIGTTCWRSRCLHRRHPDPHARTRPRANQAGAVLGLCVDPRTWAAQPGPGPPAAFYRYSPDRKGERPREHLAGFRGWMHADAFAGYDALTRRAGQPARIQHVACWAHARRKLFEVHEATKSPIAEEALAAHRRALRDRGRHHRAAAERRRAGRQARSKPLLDELQELDGGATPPSLRQVRAGQGAAVALGRWEALTRYTDDGRLAIDNNLAERLLRGIAVTRKNFLFLGSDKGGERAAILYTIAETAKLNGLDPEAYIATILDRLAAGHPINSIDDLLPWNFRPGPRPVVMS